MYKTAALIITLLGYFHSSSQVKEFIPADQWINFNRSRYTGDDYVHSFETKKYVTQQGDTLVRVFGINSEFHQVLEEKSFLHGQQNGLDISYYPNGVIREINYYLNGRIWNVISRADSNGKFYYPGSLHDGNGTRFFFDHLGQEPNCYETYKNGLPEGPFYWYSSTNRSIRGELTYKTSVVQYVPAKKITYAYAGGEITTDIFDTSSYKKLFLDSSLNAGFKVLSISDDSLPERPRDYKYIGVNFNDPAIIPKGTWQITDTRAGRTITTILYDNNGNAIRVTNFDNNGKNLSEKTFPSYNTRKW